MSISHARGSEWRKWDLHVHTPSSIYQHYGADCDEVWERYITDLENLPKEFSVLGINDYFFIDGYERLKIEKEVNNRLNNINLLLPVLEFRLDMFAGVAFGQLKRINLHVIFSDELSIDIIKSQFLNTLEQSYTLKNGSEWNNAITKESIEELGRTVKSTVPQAELRNYSSDLIEGFNNLNLSYKDILKSLSKPCFDDKYIIAIGKTEWDELKWTDSSIATKKDVINNAHIVFTASKNIETFHKAKDKLTSQGVNNHLLDCSDAHDYSSSENKDRIGNCFTWIKADPTFEGFKQVIYEHEERVLISNENPSLWFDKPYFSGIQIVDNLQVFKDETDLNFNKCEVIPLNQNLVTIVGGRGEGKSMLVEYLASSFVGNEQSKKGIFNKSGQVKLLYNKTNLSEDDCISFEINDEKHPLDVIYISQGMLKSLVGEKEEKNKLSNSIRKLARLEEVSFDGVLDAEIITKIDRYFEITSFLKQVDNQGNFINSIEYLNKNKVRIQSFISNITTEENREKLNTYASDLNILNENSSRLARTQELEDYLAKIVESINTKIISLNLSDEVPIIDCNPFIIQQSKISLLKNKINTSITDISSSIEAIKNRFEGYKGDLSTLLDDVGIYQKELNTINLKVIETERVLAEHSSLEEEIFITTDESISLIDKMEVSYRHQVDLLTQSWDNFKSLSSRDDFNDSQKELMGSLLDDLDAEVIIDFDLDVFYEKISDCIDGSKWRIKNNKNAKIEHFGVTSFETFINFLKKDFSDMCNKDGTHQDMLKEVCFNNSYQKDYIKIHPILKYKNKNLNKNLNKISVGQKGTVYLKMMLATNAFSKPIIFDQPEDDLDNGFIVKDLIALFKELKKYRQVIIVTHNANLVVNADAEQVIVATNDHGKLSYISGSLENSTINSEICKILEGGEIAFSSRRSKYQSVK